MTTDTIERKVRDTMAGIFHVPADEIKDDSSLHSIAAWDSLRHIDLVLALQKEFGIRFGDEEIPTMVNFQMVLITVRSHVE